MKIAVSRRADRLASAAFAILMQAGFLALLVLSRPSITPPERLARELTLILPRLRAIEPPATLPAANIPSKALEAPLPAVPFTPGANAPTAVPPDLSRLGQSLFGCAPQTWSSLTPEQRAACPRPGEGMAIQEAPNLMGSPSHVKDNARWANALAHEKSPVLLPGGSDGGKMFSIIGVDSNGKATGLLAGSANPEDWPTYDVKTYAPEDFYKIAPADDAWNKEHSAKSPLGAESVGIHPK